MHVACHYEVIEKPRILSSEILAHTPRQSPASHPPTLGIKTSPRMKVVPMRNPVQKRAGNALTKSFRE